MKRTQRPFIVITSTVTEGGKGSIATTREAIRLEVAMRLVADGRSIKTAWAMSDDFVKEMDRRLGELPVSINGEIAVRS